jgi:hypothetical protein
MRSSQLFNRRAVILSGAALWFLLSCGVAHQEAQRYENRYTQMYGTDTHAGRNAAVVHFEDDYVVLDLKMLDVDGSMDFRITNKTRGTATITWLNVTYEVPKTGPMEAASAGGDATVIPAGGQAQNRFAPGGTLSLFSLDSEQNTIDQITVRMPIQMDALGEAKIYVFQYMYDPNGPSMSGYCYRTN